MIERRDGGNAAHRLTLSVDSTRFAGRGKVAGENLPVIQDAELRRQVEHIRRPAGFVRIVDARTVLLPDCPPWSSSERASCSSKSFVLGQKKIFPAFISCRATPPRMAASRPSCFRKSTTPPINRTRLSVARSTRPHTG